MIKPLRPLPGIQFTYENRTATNLPRMDIVGFVGFAPRGPRHIPVLIEEVNQFYRIFGRQQKLAWDAGQSRWQTTQLAPTVRDFFAQGGQRCWVVRVAAEGDTNRFPLAGVLREHASGYLPAEVDARSMGSWSDRFAVLGEITFTPVRSTQRICRLQNRVSLKIETSQYDLLQPGEMLIIEGSRCIAYLAIDRVSQSNQSSRSSQIQVIEGRAYWFSTLPHLLPTEGLEIDSCCWIQPSGGKVDLPFNQLKYVGEKLTLARDNVGGVNLSAAFAQKLSGLQPGDWLRAETFPPKEPYWLLIDQVNLFPTSKKEIWRLSVKLKTGWQAKDLSEEEVEIVRVRKIGFALSSRSGDDVPKTLSRLGLHVSHSRFIGYLSRDEIFYQKSAGLSHLPDSTLGAKLQTEAFELDFPFSASVYQADATLIPLGIEALEDQWRIPFPTPSLESAIVRDGLFPKDASTFYLTAERWGKHLEEIFMDPFLRRSSRETLLEDAFDRIYQQELSLEGLHSLIPIEEISLIALPDVTQPGWMMAQPPPPVSQSLPQEMEETDPCAKPEALFQGEPAIEDEPSIVEEDENQTAFSIPVEQMSQVERVWHTLTGPFPKRSLQQVHQKMIDMAAARADLIAVLSPPQAFLARDVWEYKNDLLGQYTNGNTSSYAALYYPHLVERDEDGNLFSVAPDGAVCGFMARRTRSRGAWVAPANGVLMNTLGLGSTLNPTDADDLYLQGINVIQPSPRGYIVSGAHTLNDNKEWVALSVRRLFILLRRIALREGRLYLFDAHSAAFRNRVRQSMEAILGDLFQRGAFAGSTPSDAFRVTVDEGLNTAESRRQGHFIVELRVAPSQPLVFIAIRLIEADGMLTVQEG